MDDLLQEFIAETRETAEAVAGEIVGWEADPSNRARLDAIFRFVHTIKGSCGFLDLPRLARLSHAAEDALAAVREGSRVPDAALVTAILAVIDRMGEIVEAIDSGEPLPDAGEDMLVAALSAAPVPVETPPQDAIPAPEEPDRAAPGARAAKRSVRLSVDLLDRLMAGVSDMVLARNQLTRQLRETDDPALHAMLERLSMTVAELRDTVTRTRMQRIDSLFAPLARIVRDTAGVLDKTVALTVDGNDVELDREMIELLRDPLVHIVRNALDHGLEASPDRVRAGKDATGRLRVSARQSGNLIVVEIADDGRGIDTDRLVAKIARTDPARAPALARLNDQQKLELVFEPGLSARDEVTSVSGRGVGMDVVKANVEQIGGRIALSSRPGRGLTVSLEVPLTLAILNTILVDAAGARFALPRQAVEEIVAVDAATTRIEWFDAQGIATVRGRRLPLADLGMLVGGARDVESARFLAIVTLRDGAFALPLTQIEDTQEVVVKPAAPAVMRAGIYAGQVLPDDGRPALLLDCAGIAARAQLRFAPVAVAAVAVERHPPLRALLFEDMDGERRAIVADAVDRIEGVSPGSIRRAAGALWLTVDGRAVPVWTPFAADPDAVACVLRLAADEVQVAYPVRTVLDLVELPADMSPAGQPHLAAVAMVEGTPTEIVDPLHVLSAAPAIPASRPVCLLAGAEGAWMEAFLKPTIEAAGYRVTRALSGGERAAVALAMEDDAPDAVAGLPPIRLSRRRGAGIYRYDRDALTAALSERRS